jgi:hypothetical protein
MTGLQDLEILVDPFLVVAPDAKTDQCRIVRENWGYG